MTRLDITARCSHVKIAEKLTDMIAARRKAGLSELKSMRLAVPRPTLRDPSVVQFEKMLSPETAYVLGWSIGGPRC
jgi:hypothetical protein